MTETLKPDLCVIGKGPVATALVLGARACGARVVLVIPPGGGKEDIDLDLAIRAWWAAGPDLAAAAKAIARARKPGEANDRAIRLRAAGATVIEGEAHFTDRNTLVAGETRITPGRFALALGARTILPDIAGLADLPHVLVEDAADIAEPPARLAILGADWRGVAVAQLFRRAGVAVDVIPAGALLPGFDTEAVRVLQDRLRRDDIGLDEGCTVIAAREKQRGIALILSHGGQEQERDVSHVLIAGKRVASVETLAPEAAGIVLREGRIAVDRHYVTANPRVLAIGACCDDPDPCDPGRLLALALFGKRTGPAAAQRIALTRPEIAATGVDASEGAAAGAAEILRAPFSENPRAGAGGETSGFLKVTLDSKGRVLGATIAGPEAAEQIVPWHMAASAAMRLADLPATSFPAATYAATTRDVLAAHNLRSAGNLRARLALTFNRWRVHAGRT